MLGKLIKYDVKALSRYIFPAFILSLVSALFLRINILLRNNVGENIFTNVMNGLSTVLFVVSIVAISIGAYIAFIIYFYKSTLGDQGYFYMSLPASADEYLVSKILSGAVLLLSAVLVSVLSLLILGAFNPEFNDAFKGLYEIWKEICEVTSGGKIIATLVINGVFSLFSAQFVVAFCILSGQLLGKKKILGAFLAYLVLQAIEGFFGQITLLATLGTINVESFAINDVAFAQLFTRLSTGGLIVGIIMMAFEYFVARFFLTKKLNLE